MEYTLPPTYMDKEGGTWLSCLMAGFLEGHRATLTLDGFEAYSRSLTDYIQCCWMEREVSVDMARASQRKLESMRSEFSSRLHKAYREKQEAEKRVHELEAEKQERVHELHDELETEKRETAFYKRLYEILNSSSSSDDEDSE